MYGAQKAQTKLDENESWIEWPLQATIIFLITSDIFTIMQVHVKALELLWSVLESLLF